MHSKHIGRSKKRSYLQIELINSTGHSPSQVNSRSASRESPRLLWNL